MDLKTNDLQTDGQPARRIDSFDRKILGALSDNARASYAEIGHIAGRSAPAVHERVKRLKASGVLAGTTARIDGGISLQGSGCTLQPAPHLLHQALAPALNSPYRIVVTGFTRRRWRPRVCFHKGRRQAGLRWTRGRSAFNRIAYDGWPLIPPGTCGYQIGLRRS